MADFEGKHMLKPEDHPEDYLELCDYVWNVLELTKMVRTKKTKLTRVQMKNILAGKKWVCIYAPDDSGYHAGQLMESKLLGDVVMQENPRVVCDTGVAALGAVADTLKVKAGVQYLLVKQMDPALLEQIREANQNRDVDRIQELLDQADQVYLNQ